MLGKLLKYDMKAGARMMPVVYFAIAGIYLIGFLARELKIGQILTTASVLLVIGAISTFIMTVVFVIQRFYKGLFGAEGYLTQTLPVGKGHLILSKLITAYVWMVLSFAVAALAFLAMLQLNHVTDLRKLIDILFGSSFTPLFVFFTLTGCAQLLAFIGEIYFSVSLANTRPFIKNSVIFSIVFFFVSNFVVGLLELVAMLFIPLGVNFTENGIKFTTETMAGSLALNMDVFRSADPIVSNISVGIGSGFADLLAGVVLLILARWLLTHKTSVK